MDFPSRSEVPEGILSKLRFVGSISHPGRAMATMFECMSWKTENGVLELTDVLFDTSDRHSSGVILQERWSHVSQLFVGGASGWIVRPLATEER